MENLVKVALICLFLLCLLNMAYGYFQLVRFVALLSFLFLGYQSNKLNKRVEMCLYFALGLLFQPFFKIALGRTLWNIVDVTVAIGLAISIVLTLQKSRSKPDTLN